LLSPSVAALNLGGAPEAEPINLYRFSVLFVIRRRYWSCRAGNDPQDLALTPDRIDGRGIASLLMAPGW
jgi:hypothetical protein